MCRLPIFAGLPIYHLPGNFISATVGLVFINAQPEYELPSSTRFGQFQKCEKIELGALSSQPPKGKITARGLSCSYYLHVRFDLPSTFDFRDDNGFPKLDPEFLLGVTLEGPK